MHTAQAKLTKTELCLWPQLSCIANLEGKLRFINVTKCTSDITSFILFQVGKFKDQQHSKLIRHKDKENQKQTKMKDKQGKWEDAVLITKNAKGE